MQSHACPRTVHETPPRFCHKTACHRTNSGPWFLKPQPRPEALQSECQSAETQLRGDKLMRTLRNYGLYRTFGDRQCVHLGYACLN